MGTPTPTPTATTAGWLPREVLKKENGSSNAYVIT
jgi:hypothetical protein